jgi:hypothetical protein
MLDALQVVRRSQQSGSTMAIQRLMRRQFMHAKLVALALGAAFATVPAMAQEKIKLKVIGNRSPRG